MRRWAIGLAALVAMVCWLGVLQTHAAKKVGASEKSIKEAQTLLKELGLYQGEATGQLDDATKEAIKKFQTEHKLKDTGQPNKKTLKALNEAKAGGKKEEAPAAAPAGGGEQKK